MTFPTTAATNTANDKPAIIATRQHCEADGVGLSHYILMDPAAIEASTATATPEAKA